MIHVAIIHGGAVAGVAALSDGTVLDNSGYGYATAPAVAVDVTALSPRPLAGWLYDGTTFTPPASAPVPLPLQAAAALAGGITIASTGHPEVNGTYPTTDLAQRYMATEMQFLREFDVFTTGDTAIAWADVSGTLHDFDATTFRALARECGIFVGAQPPRAARACERAAGRIGHDRIDRITGRSLRPFR
jgi:hypothetical protein